MQRDLCEVDREFAIGSMPRQVLITGDGSDVGDEGDVGLGIWELAAVTHQLGMRFSASVRGDRPRRCIAGQMENSALLSQQLSMTRGLRRSAHHLHHLHHFHHLAKPIKKPRGACAPRGFI
jgi:hypothetical protein